MLPDVQLVDVERQSAVLLVIVVDRIQVEEDCGRLLGDLDRVSVGLEVAVNLSMAVGRHVVEVGKVELGSLRLRARWSLDLKQEERKWI